MNQFENK